MARAAVGDDVWGEDPTVKRLENRLAEMFGHEAGLFCPSGTMTNQIAINVHTRPGDEVICDKDAHIYKYEGGGIMANSGCSVKFVPSDRGRFKVEDVAAALNPKLDPHAACSRLVSIENTSNRGGGAVWKVQDIAEISAFCRERDLGIHLDGARIFNALTESNVSAEELGAQFDTISICLSKGLGAPVGSVLVGQKDLIDRAYRVRKRIGGGMRQVGIIAAAGLFALDHNLELLKHDHAKAKRIESALERCEFVREVLPVETNIVVFSVMKPAMVEKLIDDLEKEGILGIPFGKDTIRLVTHLDINDHDIDSVVTALEQLDP